MYTPFKSDISPASKQRTIAIGRHYHNTVRYIAEGGIDAAREVAATMGGVSKHRWSKFPQRLLELCLQSIDEPAYYVEWYNHNGRKKGCLRALHISWKYAGDTQMPVVKFW